MPRAKDRDENAEMFATNIRAELAMLLKDKPLDGPWDRAAGPWLPGHWK